MIDSRVARCRTAPVVAALLLAGCASAPPSTSPTIAAAPTREVVVLDLERYVGKLRQVRLELAGDSASFLFDTAAGETLLTPEAARKLGCAPYGRGVGFRMSGERVEFQYCDDVTLQLGGAAFHHERIAVFDLMALLPSELPPLAGVVGLNSFSGRAVTLDLSSGSLVVETDSSLATRVREMTPLAARYATGSDGASLVPFVAGLAGGLRIWLELDSGNLAGVILAPHVLRSIGERDAATAAMEGGAGVPLSAVVFEIPGLGSVGADLALDIIYDGALSAGFMEQWVFTMDLDTGRMWVAPIPGS